MSSSLHAACPVAGVYCGWIVVLALTVFMFLYMKYTKHGYEIASSARARTPPGTRA